MSLPLSLFHSLFLLLSFSPSLFLSLSYVYLGESLEHAEEHKVLPDREILEQHVVLGTQAQALSHLDTDWRG